MAFTAPSARAPVLDVSLHLHMVTMSAYFGFRWRCKQIGSWRGNVCDRCVRGTPRPRASQGSQAGGQNARDGHVPAIAMMNVMIVKTPADQLLS